MIRVLFLFFVLTSCAGRQVQNVEPRKAGPDAVALFNSIDLDLEAGATSSALKKLRRILKKYPDSDIADDTHFKMANIYFSAKRYDMAYKHYSAIYQSPVISPLENKARLKAAESLVEDGKFPGAIAVTEELVKREKVDEETLTAAYQIRLKALLSSGEKYQTLKSLAYLSTHHPDGDKRTTYRSDAIEIIETQLEDADLQKISETDDFGFLRAYALFRQGEILKEDKQFEKAKVALTRVKELVPLSDISERADLLLLQIESLKKVNPMTIGAVLPLTGRHSKVAKRVLRGLQLGLGIYGANPSGFRLAVVDSEGNPDVARRAVERLVTEDNVIAVVGSLLSKTSVAVASKSHELGVGNIGLSQRNGITETGETVFRNALTSEMQMRQLVQTAIHQLGLRKFAILYPNDNYGVAFANKFWDEVLINGGEIRAVQTYDPKETDFRTHIQRMVGTYYYEDRMEEYELRLKDWAEKQTRKSSRKHVPDDLLPPVVDFDALFIPDSPQKLGQIIPMLRYNDVDKTVLLGTNIWNSSALPTVATHRKFPTIFIDNYFAEDSRLTSSLFWKEYLDTFREEPSFFEIQAYDTGLLLRQLILSGADSREKLVFGLSSVNQFPGALGTLKINQNREFERPLVTLTSEEEQISLLNFEKLRAFVTPPAPEPTPTPNATTE